MKNRAPLALLMAAVFLEIGCATPKPAPEGAPHRTLLTILADLERFAQVDLYRFHAPVDPSGINIYRATFTRLANYESLYPGQYPDIVAFARGKIYERLGDPGAAAEAYTQARSGNTSLQYDATEAVAVNRYFQEIESLPTQAETVDDYIAALELQHAQYMEWADRPTSGARERFLAALARRGAERADVRRAEMLWRRRFQSPEGVRDALQAWQEILERHEESARIEQHRLRAGDCYYEHARDYTQEYNPEEGLFDWETFSESATRALQHYRQVERAYGHDERLEARGKIEALNAFVNRVRDRSR